LEGIRCVWDVTDGSVRALDAGALDEAGITRVLTVMSSNPHENVPPFENQTGRSREYIMMKDSVQFQSHPWYQTTSAIIDSALHTGQRILIHWYEPPPPEESVLIVVEWESVVLLQW
jgi:hypothetical protein